VQVDPVLTAVLPVGDELEVAAGQRVDRVRHTDTPVPIARIGVLDDAGKRNFAEPWIASARRECLGPDRPVPGTARRRW
jgi:hypothetical protein